MTFNWPHIPAFKVCLVQRAARYAWPGFSGGSRQRSTGALRRRGIAARLQGGGGRGGGPYTLHIQHDNR